MSDYSELKRLAEAQPVKEWSRDSGRQPCMPGRELIFYVNGPDCVSDYEDWGFTRSAASYIAAANPAAVLALIAENEGLRVDLKSVVRLNNENADLFKEKTDQLRAEIAGLKTGYEAYERVNAELKAECERLAAENTDIESAAITYIEDMQEAQHENERLTELFKVGMTLDGNLRVYGDWQSVRKAQEILAERDQLKAINFDSAAVLDAAKGEIARLKAENKALRQIISDCATSCGAAVSVECSLEFMGHLPVEIFSVISKLRNALSAGVAMGQGDRS